MSSTRKGDERGERGRVNEEEEERLDKMQANHIAMMEVVPELDLPLSISGSKLH